MKQPKPLKARLTKAVLEKLRKRKLSNREAAQMFNVSESYLSRTVAAIQEKEPGPTMVVRNAAAKLATERRHHRERLAKQVNDGKLDVAEAARRGNCSERTIKRFAAAYVPPKRTRKASRAA